ncbi:MAG: DUF4270 family protein [Thermonemataceae bacterium]|nr:DUF4270 family protein [Thermonemataceae bacterium]
MNSAVIRFLFLLPLLALIACEKSTLIGSELQPQNLGVIFTDTISVESSTILIDTVNTTNKEVILAGEYNDPLFGKVTASSYFKMQPYNSKFSFGSNPQFKSAVLSLPVYLSYGDTTQTQTLEIHKLSDSIRASRVYYNKDLMPYEATPVGTLTFKGWEASQFGKIEIPLSDSFRDEIVSLANANNSDTDSLSQADLDAFIKGLALVPQGGEAIWGFRVTGSIPAAIEIKFTADDTTEQVYRIIIRNPLTENDVANERYNSMRFNSVRCDRTGTDLQSLATDYQTLPPNSEGETFIQESLGIRTKLTFPYLKDFVANRTIAINKADLIIPVVENTYSDFYKVPRKLELIQIDADNRADQYYYEYTDPTLLLILRDTLYKRVQYEGADPLGFSYSQAVGFSTQSYSYNFDLTSFLQYTLNNLNTRYTGVNKLANNGLLVSPDLSNTGIARLVLGSAKHPFQKIKFRVFYTVVK